MPVSPYFNHVNHPGQQNLVEDLIQEAIEQRGIETIYIPRERMDEVALYNESDSNKFTSGKSIEMYIEEITSFNGQGEVFQAFGGFSIEDSVTFKVSARRFYQELGAGIEPKTGDIIYIPYADMAFEVDKKLEDEDFRQWGKNYTFIIKCTKFVYEGEEMETGVDSLDNLDDLLFEPEIDEPTTSKVDNPRDKREEVQAPSISDDILDFGD